MPVSTKREDESKPAESIEPRDTSVPTASHPAPKRRSSKTSTPVTTFSDAQQQQLQHQHQQQQHQHQHHLQLQLQHQQHAHQQHQQRVRPTRSTDPAPAKRSHKKNGSVPAAVAARAPSEEEESSLHEGEGDDEDDDGEPRYCYCNEISFGEMVACDNDACPREWFHLSCVGLSKPPGKNGMFYIFSYIFSPCPFPRYIMLLERADRCSEMVLQRMQGQHATEQEWTVILLNREYDGHAVGIILFLSD